jgi:hypothetical protein
MRRNAHQLLEFSYGTPPAFENFVFFEHQTEKEHLFRAIQLLDLFEKRHYAPLLL